MNTSRRQFSRQLLNSMVSFSLMEMLVVGDLLGKNVKPITDHWAIQMNEMCLDLRQNTISPAQWQNQIESLLDQIELEELLKFIDFDRLTRGFTFPDLGVNTKGVRFPSLAGLPENLAFYRKIFGLKKGRAIIPHGHKNMTSAHLVLKGEFSLKHYNKIEEEPEHLIIQPSIDEVIRVGDSSSISDEKNNVHWFRTLSETAFTFDMIVLDLNGKSYEIDNIDPHSGEKIGENMLRVKKLSVEEALKKYGKEMHH